jgi:hypothetical protein
MCVALRFFDEDVPLNSLILHLSQFVTQPMFVQPKEERFHHLSHPLCAASAVGCQRDKCGWVRIIDPLSVPGSKFCSICV